MRLKTEAADGLGTRLAVDNAITMLALFLQLHWFIAIDDPGKGMSHNFPTSTRGRELPGS